MKKLIAAVLACMMTASMVACSNGSAGGQSSAAAPSSEAAQDAAGSAASAPAAGGKKVGISMPTKSLERWNRDGSYLEDQFEGKGCSVELTYSDNKIDQQVKDIENLIADKVDLLVVAAIDGDSLSNVLNTAKSANIPVISYDRLIMNTDAISYYVSFDNFKVGQLQGQFVVDQLGLKPDDKSKSYNIEFTAGDPADNNATYFFNGAMDLLKPYIDAGILKIPSGQKTFQQVATQSWDTKNAMNRMQNILGSYYSNGKTTLDVALCSNDSTALGVTQAIGSDYMGSNTPIITGQDGDEANLANIIDGKQSMTVYKAVANEAVATLDIGMAMLNGQKPDESLIKSSGWKFDCSYDTKSYDNKKGIIPSYLLVPTVVTKDNIQKELVDTGYYTMDGKYPKAKK
ncbi:Multiple sugar-binding periplasmic protein SbpA [Caprobacter fermentans]|uniref:Multiple sugar-binding periplasmic protein SbpA n=1 Tax=Caproicibacter fermentans TaxID=2576756 RepID=A0A6N8HUR8_9FIRM|nr:sugar-binding protein [Caproicibacter fermentans]MVB09378.1 Multiple sugar-binding periplasmic protein SbpA [Caproicibacter fermentans]OCN02785.1 ABC transporter substrate-binding protein [Clostridium sp. W14A]QNK40476.1 sugar-binding protein [Caproicibacter fermentans]